MRSLTVGPRILCASLALLLALALPACKIAVDKNAQNGEKKVEINTPFGDVNVNKSLDAKDAGLALYPGAVLQPGDKSDESANVGITAGGFGMKVVALKYTSADPPEKVLAFYRNQLKSYGNVLECHGDDDVKVGDNDKDSHLKDDLNRPVRCNDVRTSKKLVLKAGTEGNQHVVAVEPKDSGCKFDLIYLKMKIGSAGSGNSL